MEQRSKYCKESTLTENILADIVSEVRTIKREQSVIAGGMCVALVLLIAILVNVFVLRIK